MKYPRNLPDTPGARSWWEGAYKFFAENGTKVGYPPLELPDGSLVDIHYSKNQNSVNTDKGTGLKLRSKAQQKQDSQVRGESLKQQTYGNTKLADTPTPKGYNDHHIRPRGVYQPFFEGLNAVDSKELARYAEQDLMRPLGDHPANNGRIPDSVHDRHHTFARRNTGLERGLTKKIQGMDLDQRKQALKLFLEQVQPALDEDLYKRMQAHNSGIPNALDILTTTAQRSGSKIARNGVPGAGTAMQALETADRYNEFKQQPNLMNGTQLAASTLTTGANIVSDAALATGVGAPVAAIAEKIGGISTVFESGLQVAEDYYTRP